MEQKICLDTDICIEILKDTQKGRELLETIKNDLVFVSSITIFELYLRETNIGKIDFFVDKFDIINFDILSARLASNILKDLSKKGFIIEFRDIFIAASCIINNCPLLTLNKKHFDKIDELNLINLK